MTQSPPIIEPISPLPINFAISQENPPLLACFPPIIQELYHRNKYNRQILDSLLQHFEEVVQHLQLTLGEGFCPHCSTAANVQTLTCSHTVVKPILTTGGVVIPLTVRSHRCPKCHYRTDERHELTLPKGVYDREIVLMGAAIYACGCSFEDTRNLIHSIYQLTPTISTIENWVTKLGLQAHQLNKDALAECQVKTVQIDEIFTAIHDGKIDEQHTPVFATVLQEYEFGTILHIGCSTGTQTNRAIVEANLQEIAQHHPQELIGDGCASYPGAVKAVLPQTKFIRDLVHEVRNVRKKPIVKKFIKGIVVKIKTQFSEHNKKQLADDRKNFRDELITSYSSKRLSKEEKREARCAWDDFHKWELLEMQALTEHTDNELRIIEQRLQRRLYCGREAARVAQQKLEERTEFAESVTSCQLEGTNRFFRSRERRRLCYRSFTSYKALFGLLLLLHNMVGSGQGCLYELLGVAPPIDRWNPFHAFLPRYKTYSVTQAVMSTPLRTTTTKYRRQHSYQRLPPPDLVQVLIAQVSPV